MKRNKIFATAAAFMLAFCLFSCASGGQTEKSMYRVAKDDSPDIQYIIMELTNVPASGIEKHVRDFDWLYGKNDNSSDRMIGFGVAGPTILNQSTDEIKDTINTAFYVADKYDRPVYFQMDDMTAYTDQFGGSTEVRYWENPDMCEWTEFPVGYEEYGGESHGMLPRWWFNWGSWMCNNANPCLNAQSFRDLLTYKYQTAVIPALTENYNRLLEEGRGYLFAGISVGWETHIPDNEVIVGDKNNLPEYAARGTKMQAWECTQYGAHALHNLGYTDKSLKKLADEKETTVAGVTTDILMDVIEDFIEFTCKSFYDAGFKKEKIFSHIVGCASSGKRVRTTAWPDIYTAVNEYSTPGFTLHQSSMYNPGGIDNCEFDMENIMGVIEENIPGYREYAVAEGYASGYDAFVQKGGKTVNCAELYLQDMFRVTDKSGGVIGSSRVVTCFGYDSDRVSNPTYGIDKTPEGAFVSACRKWKDREILTDFDWQSFLADMRANMAQKERQ